MLSAHLEALATALVVCRERAPLVVVTLPLALPSAANLREHWARRAARAKVHRAAACLRLRPTVRGDDWLGRTLRECPLVVRIVRIAPRPLDSDNLASACKGVRDGVADALGVDDGDERVTWVCDAEKGKAAVRIEVYEGVRHGR